MLRASCIVSVLPPPLPEALWWGRGGEEEGRRGEGEGWRGEREEAQPPSGYVGLGVLVLPPQVGSIAA